MFFKNNLFNFTIQDPLYKAVIYFLLVFFSYFFILSIGTGWADAKPSCALDNQPTGWRCPDIPKGTKEGKVHSGVVATRMIDDAERLGEIRQAMCALYDKLEGRTTQKSGIPYRPFLLELRGKNGETWSMHVGCSRNKSQSQEVLDEVRREARKLPKKQKPYLFSKPLDSVSLQKVCYIPPGRGIAQSNVNDAKRDYGALPIKRSRTIRQQIDPNIKDHIERVVCSDKQLKCDDIDLQEGALVATFQKKAKISFSDLHQIAADITTQYREAGIACSEAVVLRGRPGREIGIRICEFEEGKEDCRCPIL